MPLPFPSHYWREDSVHYITNSSIFGTRTMNFPIKSHIIPAFWFQTSVSSLVFYNNNIILLIIILNHYRILRRIFGPKRDENGEWRRLHNEELHSLYRSPNIVRVVKSRRLRWAGHVARMEEVRRALKILTGKPTGKRPLGTPRRWWEDNIRTDLGWFGSG